LTAVRACPALRNARSSWYAHPFTFVLLVTTPLPTGAEYANKRTYGERGWCVVERRLSGLVKDYDCLLDLSSYKGGADFAGCLFEMKAGRAPFMSPERVARELREGVADGTIAFTAASDVDVVVELYERGFVSAFETYNFGIRGRNGTSIFYENLGWGSKDVPILEEAIAYVPKHCDAKKMGFLYLSMKAGNQFDADDWAKLEKLSVEDRLTVR
jgi:hypothetical protein